MIINRFLSPSYSIQLSVWRWMRSLLTCGEADDATAIKCCFKIFCSKICSWRSGISITGTQRCCTVFTPLFVFGWPEVQIPTLAVGFCFMCSYIVSVLRVMPDDINQTKTASFHIPWYLLVTGRLFIKRVIIWALESSLISVKGETLVKFLPN